MFYIQREVGVGLELFIQNPTYLTLITNELVRFIFLFKNQNFGNSLNHTYFMYWKKKEKKNLNKNIVTIWWLKIDTLKKVRNGSYYIRYAVLFGYFS